ncbi:MAG: hypothetical protein GY866_29915 [Proteobacteria bacterium]|nr:hypothetical protein [Pseudomonadota bacterium]
MEKKTPVNPFENDIVSEPRRIEKAVEGLNDAPLQDLLLRFRELENDPRPRRSKLSHARFLVSPQPGYGKSHLVGRLFKELSQQATLVYMRPFEDALSCWKSILLKTVQELDFPDRVELEYSDGDVPTQLEAFAHGILVHIMTEAVESGAFRIMDKKATLEKVRRMSVAQFRKDEKNKLWMDKRMKGLTKRFKQQLDAAGIRLNASHLSWINVLFNYTYFPLNDRLRETCRDWLQGSSISAGEARCVGIRPKDIPNPELSPGEINELCKHRLLDFSHLAGFFRPFVFCFDQTENYGKETILAKTLGLVVQVLVDTAPNQMMVVTANQEAWFQNILPWLEEAHQNRFGPASEFEGLNRKQGRELIEQRLGQWNVDAAEIRGFGGDDWLDQLFKGRKELSVRNFLRECSKRWGKESDSQPSLEDCYKRSIEVMKTQPRRLVFDPNTLYWLINEVAGGLEAVTVEKYDNPRGYFSLRWTQGQRYVLFGFEAGSNGKRWQGIAGDARRLYESQCGTKSVMFRTAELQKIPSPTWKKIGPKINAAKRECLQIIHLTKSEMVELYAAHDLYMDSIEGNIPYAPEKILTFIRETFEPLWERIRKPLAEKSKAVDTKKSKTQDTEESDTEGNEKSEAEEIGHASGVSPELIEEIGTIVQDNKFMSMDELQEKLSGSVTEERIHQGCGHIPEIKVYVSPNTTVLLWQSKK